MSCLTENSKGLYNYLKTFVKWMVIALIVGAVSGVIGSVFHKSIDYVTEFRHENKWLIYLLPIGGLLITLLYSVFRTNGRLDTNRVIDAVREDEKVPLAMAPLIFVSTVITHLLGGSAGREGAALQLGGSIGYNVGKLFRLCKKDLHLIVMAGMSGVFAALFGTPLTAAFFALEVVAVGVIHYAGFVPCLISAVTAYEIALMFGITPVQFGQIAFDALSAGTLARVIILAMLCAAVSILFCTTIKKTEHYMEKLVPNKYLRTVVGALLVVLLTLIMGTTDYNGAGMEVITRAMQGEARAEAFLLKIIFTAITIAAGFKGGEIVPAFFVGSTFGCVVGSLLGLNAGFGAAIGFVSLFCGVVNCPIASVMLALEVFGADAILPFAAACSVSFMMSGYFGLYKSQKIVYSKLDDERVDINTK